MATRKKAARKKTATRKKSPARSSKKGAAKATRKKAPKKKTAARKPAKKKAAPSPRKTTGKQAGKKTVKQAAARKASSATPAPRPVAPPAEPPEVALAKRIVASANDPSGFELADFYTPDCVSIEGNGMRSEGHSGLRQKIAEWEAGLAGSTWEARKVFTRPGAIAIEWHAQIEFKDGRSVTLDELAVHELRGGKIYRERYYYDPASLAPSEPREPYKPSNISPPSDSGIDPMDL